MPFSLLSLPGLILCLAYFAAGVIDSICGGGGLITIPVLMMLGIPTHNIAGTNQCSTVLGCIASTQKYASSGNIHWKSALITAGVAIPGAVLGSNLNMLVSEQALKIFMTAMIPVLAILMLVKKGFGSTDASASLGRVAVIVRAALLGLVIGTYQGFYGAAAGMFFMLGFCMLIRLNLLKASGNARFVGLIASIVATATYAFSGQVLWVYAGAATVLNIAGNYLGAHLALTKGAKVIRPLMLAMVAALFIKLALEWVL